MKCYKHQAVVSILNLHHSISKFFNAVSTILTVLLVEIPVYWNMTPCELVYGYRRSSAATCLHFQDSSWTSRHLLWSAGLYYVLVGKDKFHFRIGHDGPQGKQKYSSTLSLTSALDGVGGQRHASATLSRGQEPCTHCIGGWLGTRAGLDGCGRSRPHHWDSNPGPSSP